MNITADLVREKILFKNALKNVRIQSRKNVNDISSYLLNNEETFKAICYDYKFFARTIMLIHPFILIKKH